MITIINGGQLQHFRSDYKRWGKDGLTSSWLAHQLTRGKGKKKFKNARFFFTRRDAAVIPM